MADIYYLKRNDLLKIQRLAEKSVNKLLSAIEASKTRPLPFVLVALGISHVGSEVAEILTSWVGSIKALMASSETELMNIPSIGPKTAKSIVAYFKNESNRSVIEKLQQARVQMENYALDKPREHPLSSLRFVVTGRLENFSRSQIEMRIRNLGGSVGQSVSSKTNFLIAGKDAGSNFLKAHQLKIKTLTEKEFLELIEG